MGNILRHPTVIVGLIEAVIIAVAAFGFKLSTEQFAAVIGLATAILTTAATLTTQPTPAAARRLGITK